MFQIDSIDKYDLKHPKKNKNSIFFKINMINLDEYGKMKGMFDKSSINSPSKSPGKSKENPITIYTINNYLITYLLLF